MSADRLREAARVLRERAERAVDYWTDALDPGQSIADFWAEEFTPIASAYDGGAPLIATMHPGVALAVADLLDHEAGLQDRVRLNTFANVRNGAAYALADAILGGTK